MLGVLLAVLALAVGTACLGNVDLSSRCQRTSVGIVCPKKSVQEATVCDMSERDEVANGMAGVYRDVRYSVCAGGCVRNHQGAVGDVLNILGALQGGMRNVVA